MRVTSLHKWPFNPEDVTAEMSRYEFSEFHRESMIELHQNAWIIVLQHDGPASDIDFDLISYAASAHALANPMDRQVPWLEQVLTDTPEKSSAVFFIHHINPEGHFFYGEEELPLPAPTDSPPDLAAIVQYECP